MYILELYQDGYSTDLAAFKTLKEGREFISQLDAYASEEEDGFTYEYIKWNLVPDYMEIEHKGHIIPLTRFMFTDGDRVDIYWKEIPNLSNKGSGMVKSATRVDAYSINNEDVKDYIEAREENYKKAKKALEEKGFEVERSFLGSEDGEAILYRKKGDEEWHFLTHMDPGFEEGVDIQDIISEICG